MAGWMMARGTCFRDGDGPVFVTQHALERTQDRFLAPGIRGALAFLREQWATREFVGHDGASERYTCRDCQLLVQFKTSGNPKIVTVTPPQGTCREMAS